MRIRQIVEILTLILSSFLLFAVEPLSSKELLPKMGGSSAVWLTCLCFFQVSLLLGYMYTVVLTAGVRQRQAQRVHLVFLALAVCWVIYRLHVTADISSNAEVSPTWTIFRSLTLELGLPFFLLSASAIQIFPFPP